MSVKIMGIVFDIEGLPPPMRLVLLAYADHADHDGRKIYPSVERIARKTGYSDRQVQRITAKLLENNYLVPDHVSDRIRTNQYRIPIDQIKGDILTPLKDEGDKTKAEGVTNEQKNGNEMSPEPSLTVLKHESVVNTILDLFKQDLGFREKIRLNSIVSSVISMNNNGVKIAFVVPDEQERLFMENRWTSSIRRIAVGIINQEYVDISFVRS